MSKQPSIKILINCHKPSSIVKNDVFVPIHLGRALTTQASKDGTISYEDYEWMLDNMIGDDTGDNISELNRHFNEMTGIYWAWKNYDKLGNPDYIGFCHYRRYFSFYKDSFILESIKKHEIISGKFWSPKGGLYGYFNECPKEWPFEKSFYSETMKIINELYPEQYKLIDEIMHKEICGGFRNMFIMKKDCFFHYCNWIFPILMELYKRKLNFKYKCPLEERNIAWIAEVLTSLYLYMSSSKYNIMEQYISEIKFKKEKQIYKNVKTLFNNTLKTKLKLKLFIYMLKLYKNNLYLQLTLNKSEKIKKKIISIKKKIVECIK